ncbi:MAG TPA: GspH/FimT family pseudopilin [Woeseiaceae bacterium]|nr:GspH/FimT family pseudopilin [Woeseiaceae bacterium]
MKNPSQRGFTVYELLITLLIVGVVLTLGIPNLSDFTQNSRIAGTVNDLHSSFLLARSEAARAKTNVTICASANSMTAGANCDGGSFDNGWIIFLDLNGDIDRSGAGENVLRRHGPIPDAIDITPNGGAAYFSFASTGLGRGDIGVGPALQTAMICDDRGNTTAAGGASAARYLVVTPLGRSNVIREVSVIQAAGGCP